MTMTWSCSKWSRSRSWPAKGTTNWPPKSLRSVILFRAKAAFIFHVTFVLRVRDSFLWFWFLLASCNFGLQGSSSFQILINPSCSKKVQLHCKVRVSHFSWCVMECLLFGTCWGPCNASGLDNCTRFWPKIFWFKIAIGCVIFIWWLFVPFTLMTIIWIANDSAAFSYYTSDQGNALHEAAQPLTRTACVTCPNWLGASVDTHNAYTNYVAPPDLYTDNDHMPIRNILPFRFWYIQLLYYRDRVRCIQWTRVALKNVRVALLWQSGNESAKWHSIGIIDPDFGLNGSGLVWVVSLWHSGTWLAITWHVLHLFHDCCRIALFWHKGLLLP